MRACRFPRPLGAAGMHQQHRLAESARPRDEIEETRRPADLLEEQHEEPRLRIVEHGVEEILGARDRFVAGRDRVIDGDALGAERRGDVAHHRAALRDHRRAVLARGDDAGLDRAEGHRDAIDEIGKAHAIGPFEREPGVARQRRDLLLLGAAFLAGLGKARREERDAADAALDAAADRIGDGGFRHDQHRGIDAWRQIGDGRHAAPAADLRARRVTRWISPGKPTASRLARTRAPGDAGSAEAPTIAIERGRSSRSIALRDDTALMAARHGPRVSW